MVFGLLLSRNKGGEVRDMADTLRYCCHSLIHSAAGSLREVREVMELVVELQIA
ncbi:MAG: hypothetical protein LUQ04_10475 [Methanoregula sp.]|nr:hypothetical protein [Methanoregula sp.]